MWERLSFDDEYEPDPRRNSNPFEDYEEQGTSDERVNKEMERLWQSWKKEKRRR